MTVYIGFIEQSFIMKDPFSATIREGVIHIRLCFLVAFKGPETFDELAELLRWIDRLVLHCRGFACTIYEFVRRGAIELYLTDYIC